MMPSGNRLLNGFLTTFIFPSLDEIADDEALILFAAYISTYEDADNEWGVTGSKKAIEAILKRYFGVEKIYHERSGLYRSESGMDVDYPLDGVGSDVNEWVNATKFTEIGNGTFSVEANWYYSEYLDDSFFNDVSQWKLKNKGKIINGSWDSVGEGDVNVYRDTEKRCVVTLKPFVYKGKNTWQIAGINGFVIPKVLFAR
jgi:hypothetical protein